MMVEEEDIGHVWIRHVWCRSCIEQPEREDERENTQTQPEKELSMNDAMCNNDKKGSALHGINETSRSCIGVHAAAPR